MTLQIGIRVADGSIVLASDTLVRGPDQTYMGTQMDGPHGEVNKTKILLTKHHDLAIAFAGYADTATKPAAELADYLSDLSEVPDNLGPILKSWGDDFFSRTVGVEAKERFAPTCTLMVVNPHTQYCCFWKLLVNKKSLDDCSSTYMVNGLGANTSIFWPQYFKAKKYGALDLESASGVAALMILTAAEIDPERIGGLEMYRYFRGKWNSTEPPDIAGVHERFMGIDRSLKDSVAHLVTPSRSAPET